MQLAEAGGLREPMVEWVWANIKNKGSELQVQLAGAWVERGVSAINRGWEV